MASFHALEKERESMVPGGLELLWAHQARDAKRQGEGNHIMIPLTLPLNVIKESEAKLFLFLFMFLFGCVSQKHL
jgi:hypothetical protein